MVFCFFSLVSTLTAQSDLQQSLTLRLENVPISEALLEISASAGVDITFSPSFFSKDKRISLVSENEPLESVLDHCLDNTGIGYRYSNGLITLFRQYYTVSGYVIDASTGERLTGANIVLPGQNTGTFTNSYGYFSPTIATRRPPD